MTMTPIADYIIVGAGSAGCVLAARLSEDRDVSVLLLEAGGSDASPFVRMPSAFSIPMNSSRYDWGWHTDPEPYMDGRRLHCPRGRVLGGSSSINGMVWVRGHPRDFDRWAELGASGWDWAGVAPYFRRVERFTSGVGAQADPRRGLDGPVGIRQGDRSNPLYGAFLDAAAASGYAVVDDLNGARQEGFGPLDMNVADGMRASSYRAWLVPVLDRPNLEVRARQNVERLELVDGGDGPRATGVVLTDGTVLRAGREVISAAGAIGSPTLLLRSGIGPGERLQAAGVAPRVELAGVGENLMDHLEAYVQQACTQPISLNGRLTLLGKALIGARWLLRRDGLGATNHFEAGGFIRSTAGVEWPDIQFHFLPAAVRYDGRDAGTAHGFQAHVGPMRPESRGRIRLCGPKLADAPSIRFDYLAAEIDREVFRRALRLTREIFAAEPFAALRGEEIAPGPDAQDDSALDAFVRERAESAYHPCGTCAMGEGPAAVVDSECRVRGVRGLRVIDSSIFPDIPNGNLNAPTTMLADRASDLVRGRAALAREPLPYYSDPEQADRQRSV